MNANPRKASLNDHLFQAGVRELSRTFDVRTSDLYAQDFDPVLSDRDLGELAGSTGNIGDLASHAHARGLLTDEVREEQAKLAAGELLVLQFPPWWYGPPAILKGWIDRVFLAGFAFGDLDPELGVPRRYGDGGLAGRSALIIVTAGEDERTLSSRGVSGDLDTLLLPLTHGALWYTGIASFPLHVVYDADTLSSEDGDREADRLRARLAGIPQEPTRLFRRLRDGDYSRTRSLREDLLPGRTDLGIHVVPPSEQAQNAVGNSPRAKP
ncbi:NAD(P)H-dependent oxidoreductase [Brachybacterium halotolerans]|uniref:NAD(P)H-dependent oxidoreductase n=1 Tax=Brachybacterium halotolerans TaxID=2795215 RepID=UPI00225B3504|nr:NAD(P)H-dependent oxidoreductase [Brachybacterium halotolerans]